MNELVRTCTSGTAARPASLLKRKVKRGVTDLSDIVIQFPVQHGEEAQLFGAYLAEFMESLMCEIDRWVDGEAPMLMVRSDPLQDVEVKILTFEHQGAAQAFSSGWAQARTRLDLV